MMLRVGSGLPNIQQKALKNIKLHITTSSQEQQKIAACLTSLDELITAHAQKLEALKDHKNGLLQNLFPQEGETVPRLRFPEFEGDGEWVEKSIGSIAKVHTGGTPNSTESKYWGGNIPWMNSGELNLKRVFTVSNSITQLGLEESSTKKIPPFCVLIGLAGQGKTRGTAAINYLELCTNQSIAAILPNKKIFDSEFLFQKIDSMYETLRRLSTGQGGRGGLNLSIIREIEISLPSIKEQQKVSSCLTVLDGLINTQAERIEQLLQHKKGLMQGLFPAPSDRHSGLDPESPQQAKPISTNQQA
jgi:type I restriction enzyme S subunit